MTHVATLISAAPATPLDERLLGRAYSMLAGATATQWLDEGVAADILFTPATGADLRALAASLGAELRPLGIDVVVQPLAHRRKRLLVADMDSTMIEQECIDELADKVGLKDRVAAITERAMRGEIPFEPALRERVALLQGLPASVVDELIRERITLMPGAQTLVRTMRAHGAYTCLISGGFTVFTEQIARAIGFDDHRANTLMIADGVLTGRVREPILGREAKRATLIDLRERLGCAPDETLALGDGANDLDMLREAGLGIAFRAKPHVAEAAAARIDRADLTAALYAQGFRRADFA